MTRGELLEACFGKTDLPEGERIFEIMEGADVLAHVDLGYRRILHRPETAPGPGVSVAADMVVVAAISNVCTDPAHRGNGYATQLLRIAHEEAAKHSIAPFAALFAGPAQRPFYERLGYFHPEDVTDLSFMVCLLAEKPWPAGSIDTRGTW